MKNTQKGITLIALIITIIVMLILVGVSVSVALNTGLFKSAQGAAKNTEAHKINETAISNGTVTVGNTTDSIQNIVNSYKGGATEAGPIEILNNGTTQYTMTINGTQYIIDENTTFEQLAANSDYSFTRDNMGYVIIDNAYCLVGEAGGIPHSFYSSEEDFPNESIVSIVSYYGFLEPAFGINYTEWKSGELSYMPSEPAYTITFTEISA